MNNTEKYGEDLNFEMKLFHSLREYGYVFPVNGDDINRFEQIYGDTEIDFPPHLQSIERLKEKNSGSQDNVKLRMAAFSKRKKTNFNISQDDDNKENSDDNDSQNFL